MSFWNLAIGVATGLLAAVFGLIELVAFVVLGMGAWLGGELVDRLGVGVDDGAHLDAPSSLREKQVGTPSRHGA